MISPSQRPLPDNTQHSQQTNVHAPGEIRTHDRSRWAAVDLRLRPRGYWNRHPSPPLYIYFCEIFNVQLREGSSSTSHASNATALFLSSRPVLAYCPGRPAEYSSVLWLVAAVAADMEPTVGNEQGDMAVCSWPGSENFGVHFTGRQLSVVNWKTVNIVQRQWSIHNYEKLSNHDKNNTILQNYETTQKQYNHTK